MTQQPSADVWPCATEGCSNLARGHRHKYCHTCLGRHRRQSRRRRPAYATPLERLWRAAEAVAEAAGQGDEAYRNAVKRRSKALRAVFARELARLRVQDDVAGLLAQMQAPAVADVRARPDSDVRGSEQRTNCEEAAKARRGETLPEG